MNKIDNYELGITNDDWVECELIEACEIHDNLRKPINSSERNKRIEGKPLGKLYPYYGATGQVGYIDDYLTDGDYILIGEDAAPFYDYTKDVAYHISGKTWVNNHAHILKSNFNDNFLLHYLNCFNYHGYVSGTTRLKLTQSRLKQIPLKLAPLPIQRAIVSKIESLFSDLDNGIANLKKAQEQLKIYRQAVLKKAFEGELTKEWREEIVQTHGRASRRADQLPTAEELLKQIKEERQKNYELRITNWKKAGKEWELAVKAHGRASQSKKPTKPKAIKELPPLTEDELKELPKLPDGWGWMKLVNFTQDMCLGKMLDKKKNQGDYKQYLGNINVRWGKFDLNNLKEMRFLKLEIERFRVLKGDLIICEGGEPGRCAIWQSDSILMIQKALHRVRFFQYIVNSNYIFHFFKYSAFSGHLTKNFTGTTIKHLTGQGLEKLTVPLCSIPEQHQIVQEIESRLSVCDKVEQSITESLEKAKALRQSILKKAFEGKLLSEAEIEACKQEKDYEPASVLLEKIKAEKQSKDNSRIVSKKKIRK